MLCERRDASKNMERSDLKSSKARHDVTTGGKGGVTRALDAACIEPPSLSACIHPCPLNLHIKSISSFYIISLSLIRKYVIHIPKSLRQLRKPSIMNSPSNIRRALAYFLFFLFPMWLKAAVFLLQPGSNVW